ncbi:alpha/beta hydrolase [Uliginosibacterium sp. sgz301328]|uniref:alpha/beta hydrolase n=1 Tax=Uliginosibacterium sp. sgz301328 TaxID=3243764 RepID=UPI00359DA58E
MSGTPSHLEILSCLPQGAARATPLLFVHGAYAGAWCWDDHFLSYFASHGWSAHAVSLSGHGGSAGREHLDALSIDDYVNDVREAIASLPARPVLVGHSMGGLVVQKLLEHEDVPGVVLMCSVPPGGLAMAAAGLLFQRPAMLLDLNRVLGGGQPHLDTLREALFHQPVTPEVLQSCFLRMQPESMRAVWDMTLFALPSPARMYRPPMLILGAEHDTLIPARQVVDTGETYGVQAEIFADMGHGLMLERDWRQVADRIREWLDEQGY